MDTHERVAQPEQREGEAPLSRIGLCLQAQYGRGYEAGKADALAASQEKLERANEDRREVQRVLQAQLQASQEKERQLREALEELHAEVEMGESVGICLENRAPALCAGALLAALDSTQTHGGSDD